MGFVPDMRFNLGLLSVGGRFTQSDADRVQQVVDYLGSKRAMWGKFPEEEPDAVIGACLDIRRFLNERLSDLPPRSKLRPWLHSLNGAFADFMTHAGSSGANFPTTGDFIDQLRILRFAVAAHVNADFHAGGWTQSQGSS